MFGKPETANNKTQILVVDDSRVMRKAIERVLKNDFDLIEAGDGESAWEAIRQNPDIGVIISDIQMPVLDGYGLICRVRADEDQRIAEKPVIVITGAEDEITKERAYACGANDFVLKPIDSGQLLDAIGSHLGTGSVNAQTGVDPLTQIASREAFMQQSATRFAESQQAGDQFSMIRLDVDNFDIMRRDFGDDVVDQLLVWTSKMVLSKVRKEDIVGQMGRSHFAIATSSAGRIEAAVLCDRIRTAISSATPSYEGKPISITLSIGLASTGADMIDSAAELMELTAQRAAVASSRGGNQIIASDSAQNGNVEETIMAEPDIETALEIIAGTKSGSFDPYALDLAQRVLPLLEYCDEKFDLAIDREITAIRARLAEI